MYKIPPLPFNPVRWILIISEKIIPLTVNSIIHEGYAVGYCALGPYKKKKAYNRTAEICIYLKPENIDKGIGTRAVRYIEKTARENGIKILLAFITAENEPSVRLFKKLGYYQCAHFKKIGEKFNRVLDVLVYQKEI